MTSTSTSTWMIGRRGGDAVVLEDAISIGKDPSCTIALDGPAVSPIHCRIHRSAGPLVLSDESAEGTRINGLRSERISRVTHGDIIAIGDHELTVEQIPSPASKPISVHPISIDLSFQVATIENVSTGEWPRYFRDAVRLRAGCALLVMLDLVRDGTLDASTQAQWKGVIRAAAARSREPDAILRVLNGALFIAGQKATASCAVLDAPENLLSFSSAGAPPLWIVRARERVVRAQTAASIELGSVKGASFAVRRLHFDPRDALILPSAEWAARFEGKFAAKPPFGAHPADWLRTHPDRPEGGCALCMTLG